MKRFYKMSVYLTAFICIAGCTGKQPEQPPASVEDPVQQTPSAAAETSQPELSLLLSVEKPEGYETCAVYTADEGEEVSDIYITANTAVNDLKLLRLRYSASGKCTGYQLYETDSVNEKRALLVHMMFYGDLPSYGVSCRDQEGNQFFYQICQSGEDGSVSLIKTDEIELFRYEDENMYSDILDTALKFASGEAKEEIADGMIGVYEITQGTASLTGLSRVGYTFMDLNGDGYDELLIAETYSDNLYAGSRIMAVYTYLNGMPVLAAEGSYRNRYFVLEDGSTIYNEGSAGAAYTIFSTGVLSANEPEIKTADYYFSHEREEGDWENIGYYHNTSGEFDTAVSEELDISAAEFFGLMGGYEEQIMELSLSPLSDYISRDN